MICVAFLCAFLVLQQYRNGHAHHASLFADPVIDPLDPLVARLRRGSGSAPQASLQDGVDSPTTSTPCDHPLCLAFREPAQPFDWTRSLPIGNGRIGALMFGQPWSMRVPLSDDTLFAGAPRTPPESPHTPPPRGKHPSFIAAREAMLAGDIEAMQPLAAPMAEGNTEGFEYAGDLLVEVHHAAEAVAAAEAAAATAAAEGVWATLWGGLAGWWGQPSQESQAQSPRRPTRSTPTPQTYARWLDMRTATCHSSFQYEYAGGDDGGDRVREGVANGAI